jgi:hypothetical protein
MRETVSRLILVMQMMDEVNKITDSIIKCIFKTFKICLLIGWCNNCKMPTIFIVRGDNLREDLSCLWCRSFNRQRQIRYVFDRVFKSYSKPLTETVIWNTENSHALHEKLKKLHFRDYISSEFLGQDVSSGAVVNGVRHEDVCSSSFPSNCFDFIFSGDVLEHVPEPRKALFEIHRVLKPGGKHIFTVPFIEGMPQSEVRAIVNSQGVIEYLKDALYHGDPLRKDGILVYTIFGEDLKEMCIQAGLKFQKNTFSRLCCGIVGKAIVFVVEKDAL